MNRTIGEVRKRLLLALPGAGVVAAGLVYAAGHAWWVAGLGGPPAETLDLVAERGARGLERAVDAMAESLGADGGGEDGLGGDGLVRLRDRLDLFTELTVYDTFGSVVATTSDQLSDGAAREDLLRVALTGIPVLAAPRAPAGPGEETFLTLMVPVLDGMGQPERVVAGVAPLGALWSRYGGVAAPSVVTLALLDALGGIIHLQGPPVDFSGGPNDGPLAGDGFFHAAREVRPGSGRRPGGWSVLALYPRERLAAVWRRATAVNTVAAAITLGLVSLVGLGLTRRVYAPMETAARAARRLSQGQLDAAVPEDGPVELRDMAAAINLMASEVRYHRHTLSTMVQSRTRTLEAARKALEERTARLRASYDSAQDAVMLVDVLTGEILQTNRRLAEVFGMDEGQLDVLTRDDVCELMAKMFEQPADFVNRWTYYNENPDAEGAEEWDLARPRRRLLSVYTAPVRGDGNRAITGRLWTFRDITQQRQFDEQVRQAQKMEVISHLAGSIAHDFSNLLTVVRGNLSLAALEAQGNESAAGYLAAAERASGEAGALVRQLLGFSDQARMELCDTDLGAMVGGVCESLKAGVPAGVQVVRSLAGDLWPVPADAAQIEQALRNLILHSLDTMPGGGRLVIGAENTTVDRGAADRPSDLAEGDYVRLTIADSGPGHSAPERERIFEPFAGGGGNGGLGLAMAFGVVRKHGGWIECESEVGQGTQFTILLPRAEQRAEPMKIEQAVRPAGGREDVVLVVDDEPGVRRIAVSVLRRSRFQTLEAADGDEAIRLYREQGSAIGLVLLDLSMPKVSGRETFKALKQMCATLPILMCSGYPVSCDEFERETGHRPEGVIQKPFDIGSLGRTVREAMGGVVAARTGAG